MNTITISAIVKPLKYIKSVVAHNTTTQTVGAFVAHNAIALSVAGVIVAGGSIAGVVSVANHSNSSPTTQTQPDKTKPTTKKTDPNAPTILVKDPATGETKAVSQNDIKKNPSLANNVIKTPTTDDYKRAGVTPPPSQAIYDCIDNGSGSTIRYTVQIGDRGIGFSDPKYCNTITPVKTSPGTPAPAITYDEHGCFVSNSAHPEYHATYYIPEDETCTDSSDYQIVQNRVNFTRYDITYELSKGLQTYVSTQMDSDIRWNFLIYKSYTQPYTLSCRVTVDPMVTLTVKHYYGSTTNTGITTPTVGDGARSQDQSTNTYNKIYIVNVQVVPASISATQGEFYKGTYYGVFNGNTFVPNQTVDDMLNNFKATSCSPPVWQFFDAGSVNYYNYITTHTY